MSNDLIYFTPEEFVCSHTGKSNMDASFLLKLDALRASCGFPFHITSGYRHPSHPAEARKKKAGTHASGIAVDIAITNGAERHTLVAHALAQGFTGVGIARTFIHVDTRDTTPVIWLYH